jgi:hypothetical protein
MPRLSSAAKPDSHLLRLDMIGTSLESKHILPNSKKVSIAPVKTIKSTEKTVEHVAPTMLAARQVPNIFDTLR